MWWVLLAAGLFVIHARHSYAFRGFNISSLDSKYILSEIFNEPAWLVPPLAGVIWVLAAQAAVSAYGSMLKDATLGSNKPVQALIRFRLAMAQAFIPAVLIWIYSVFVGMKVGFVLEELLHWNTHRIMDVISCSGWALYTVCMLLWVAAFIALVPHSKLLIWLGAAAVFADHYFFMYLETIFVCWTNHGFGEAIKIGQSAFAVLSLVGVVALSLSLLLIARRLKGGYAFAVVLSCCAIVGNIGSDFHVSSLIAEGWAGTARWLIGAATAIPEFAPLGWADCRFYSDSCSMSLWFSHYDWNFGIRCWQFWLVISLQVAILAGYYFFIRWLITRPRITGGASGT